MSRDVPASMTAAWRNQAKVGGQRPVVRAIIQKHELKKFDYDTAWALGGTYGTDRHRTGWYTTMIFGDMSYYREIRNIQSCSWERSIEQDVATCQLTFLNSDMTPIGEPRDNPSHPNEFDKPGWFTYNRGQQKESDRWGYDEDLNGWQDVFVPDMVVKTFEGYGIDTSVTAARDGNLVQSGTWLIDKVTYNADGTTTLEMRDLGRMLLDQIVFPPVIPYEDYPLTFSAIKSRLVKRRDAKGGRWEDRLWRWGSATSSNDHYVGKGFTNAPFKKYVGSNGGVMGHHARHALLYHHVPDHPEHHHLGWRSTGQDSRRSFVWWQYNVDSGTLPIAAIRTLCMGGPFRMYISIHNGKRWVGKKKIPWQRNGDAGTVGDVNIHADIPFVKSVIADRFFQQDITLPRKYKAKKIRLTFTRLNEYWLGEHTFHAGLRELQIYTGNYANLSFGKGDVLKVIGNYGDFTHIIKHVCAWGGFWWPPHSTGMDFMRINTGDGPEKDWITFFNHDPTLVKGRVWGDFMRTGTKGEADLGVELFDKKPLMDIINYVRDLVGFNFWIDELGGPVWRMPNLWSLGNYRSPEASGEALVGKRGRHGRTSEIVTLDEEETLLDYSTTLDSTNVRERIFVANAVGGKGTVIKGFNPFPVHFRRLAGWTDQHFETKRETRVMADMISARQMFTYKVSQAVIPGYPKIQIDDQVRIFERVTNETFYHYVMGIKSELDMDSGVWTYTLTTHWLGEDPSDAWVVKVEQLDKVTQAYLNVIGYEGSGPEDKDD